MINKNIITAAALVLFGSAFQANAQTDIVVKGTVKDIYGNPLPGVVVSANHKDLYITDKNGEYTATTDRSDKLTFSLLGYKQAELPASGTMEVVLEDDAHNLAQLTSAIQTSTERSFLTPFRPSPVKLFQSRSCQDSRVPSQVSSQVSPPSSLHSSLLLKLSICTSAVSPPFMAVVQVS